MDDYLTVKDADSLGLKNNSFTVLAWVKPTTLTGDRSVLGTATGLPQQGLHLILRNGKPYFGFYNDDTASNTSLSTGEWAHLAWVYDKTSQTQSIYINGVLDTTQSGRPPFLGSGTVYIGRSLGGGYFAGQIDHLEIVKEALTVAQIKTVIQEAPTLNLHLDESVSTTSFTNDGPSAAAATCTGTACPRLAQKGKSRSTGL